MLDPESGPFEVKIVTIDPVLWTKISPPIDCKKIVLSRGADNDTFLVRSKNGGFAKTIAAGWEHPMEGKMCLYPKDVAMCEVKAGTIVGNLIIEAYR